MYNVRFANLACRTIIEGRNKGGRKKGKERKKGIPNKKDAAKELKQAQNGEPRRSRKGGRSKVIRRSDEGEGKGRKGRRLNQRSGNGPRLSDKKYINNMKIRVGTGWAKVCQVPRFVDGMEDL